MQMVKQGFFYQRLDMIIQEKINFKIFIFFSVHQIHLIVVMIIILIS